MLIHPNESVLLRWADGELVEPDPALVNHVTTCQICQQRLAQLLAEGDQWQRELALTTDERRYLAQADLPTRVVTAVQAERQRGRQQLFGLFGACLIIALTWALVADQLGPLLDWAGRLVTQSGLLIEGSVRLIGLAVTWLGPLLLMPDWPAGWWLLIGLAGLLLVSLWLYRRRSLPLTATLA